MWYKNVDTRFFHFVTKHVFNRQTDRRLSHGCTLYSVLSKVTIEAEAVCVCMNDVLQGHSRFWGGVYCLTLPVI